MILHNNPTALIAQGNTLTDPKFKDGDTLKTFDYVVANPPFSDKRWSTGLDPLTDPFDRFKSFGDVVPPKLSEGHLQIIHAIEEQDVELAESLARDHTNEMQVRFLDYLGSRHMSDISVAI